MSLLIGMDEAGLGPNLGPFVVAATVWDVPGAAEEFDFWTAFDTVLSQSPGAKDPRLHVADSKKVFQPHKGLATLERGVRAAFGLCGLESSSFKDLCTSLTATGSTAVPGSQHQNGKSTRASGKTSLFEDDEVAAARCPSDTDPITEDAAALQWYATDLSLPTESHDPSMLEPWRQCCERLGVRLVAIKADIVEPLRFNRLVNRFDNKSQATSRISMNLLKSVWNPDDDALVVGDKHGGRNRYDTLLQETFAMPVESIIESAEQSCYRVGRGELRFQPRAEAFGPVALASMTAKYVRELAMVQFNRYWQSRIPGLKPTQGYPVDAKRFRSDVDEERRKLKIADASFWRER